MPHYSITSKPSALLPRKILALGKWARSNFSATAKRAKPRRLARTATSNGFTTFSTGQHSQHSVRLPTPFLRRLAKVVLLKQITHPTLTRGPWNIGRRESVGSPEVALGSLQGKQGVLSLGLHRYAFAVELCPLVNDDCFTHCLPTS